MAERDHFGFEHPARPGPHDQQVNNRDEQAVRKPSEDQLDPGRRWRTQAGILRSQAAEPSRVDAGQGTARVFGTYTLE
jgi:hypothetical protein